MTGKQGHDTSLIIVGGGITGLASAYFAAKSGYKVTVLEAGDRFGGLLNTFEIGDNRLEFYYHHFFTHDLELNWLIQELGLKDSLFYKKTSMGVYHGGKIYPFNTPTDLLKFKPIRFVDKIRFGLTSLYLSKVADWKKLERISCLEWFEKWAGKSTTSALWKPLLNIKFGPYASRVPLAWMVGRLRQRMNSRKSGDERLGYLQGSLNVLLDRLLLELERMGVELCSSAPVIETGFEQSDLAWLKTPHGVARADRYLFTIPSPVIAKLFQGARPSFAREMDQVKYFGAVCVILEMADKLSDIYWLNIADNELPFGGIIEHTNFISPEEYNGRHIAYLSRYFASDEPIATMTNEAIADEFEAAITRVYPNYTPSKTIAKHVFKTPFAATVCDLGFSSKVPNCATEIPNVFVANMAHVYPDERSTNNSIRIAATACRAMGINTHLSPKTNSLSATIGFDVLCSQSSRQC